ncbi:NACHT, LRR and PYD domains-containing protein 1 homolog isoform X4 [Ctenopharyngodon idella]|uniref:NACHT, LRR and PYD domains-containing protein 1 homolog isoform X4 n=1 Tax=Ctenopharyngodon idella TaxID=7959 RepID=UPI00222FCE61|nr:NACHT, LRR and PYD domains-containing protein 1 homolog isoform X4 [Ctenopharyngodon idella]
MEVPDDFNFSDLADSPELKRRRKYPEPQKQADAQEDHLALLPPTVPIKISHGFKKILPTIEYCQQLTPHSLSMTEPITQTSGAVVNSSDSSKPEYMKKRSREIYKRQDLGAQDIVHQYKLSVKKKYENVLSFLCGEQETFSAMYTEPVIMQKNANGSFKIISVSELFQMFLMSELFDDPITIILQGNSGSGKSTIAQKIMLDWASEAISASFLNLVFYLRCEELMCISAEMNLIELLSYNCGLTSDQISQMLQQSPEKVLFIIDGFDKLRLTQDIYQLSPYADPLQEAPPEVILCALLRGHILPESFLLVTTRTKETVNKLLKGQSCFTEIMGFYEKEVEKYFQKFSFIKAYYSVMANETLFTTCSIPVICRIIVERVKFGAVASGLKTTTSIYVDFVSTLLKIHCQGLSRSVPTLLRSLGQLAETGMLEQQVLFEEKSLQETVSDPAYSPFLCNFLFKRRIHQETMFRFMHLSFQEFFTALYYVLLDEEESQRKVRELLHTVERGWALSCWSDRDFSIADVEVRHAKLLQPVILFLCGLCQKEWIPSFFEKHNMAVSINIETQLKEWLNQCSPRYQNEHMLFILHCLYELHDKSFVEKVLEGLILIDLSNIPLKMTDCWVLKYCLQCCEHIRNLKLHVTSDNLKMLQPELYRCKELWLKMDRISDDVVGLISAAGKGKILNKLIVKMLENSGSVFCPEVVSVKNGDIMLSVGSSVITETSLKTELTLTCPDSLISTIKWVKLQKERALYSYRYFGAEEEEVRLLTFLQSVSDLKKVCLQVSSLTNILAPYILSLIQNCPSLIELSINSRNKFLLKIQSLKQSLKQMGWIMTVWRKSMFIQPDAKRFTKVELKIKREKSDSKRESSDSVSYSSLKAESSSAQSSSEDAEVFTPELIHGDDEDKHKNTYRFLCPHAGQFQCSLTNLVFVMEGEGKMQYKIVSWDSHVLDGLGQMQAAGPLYNIDCSAGSVSKLHFPHCEIFSEENKDGLAVAHFTGGNVEIIQPLKVTETHVIIDIRELSNFVLVWIKSKLGFPIRGQVLLFLRALSLEKNKLNVHLLPENVPVSEVQSRHQDKKYIETSSKCHLILNQEYSLCCQPEECEVQPKTEMFECNFGPNYHPTFEVFLDVNIEEVRLGILDKTEGGKEVWNRRRIFLTVAPSKGVEPPKPEIEFVNTHGDKLIQRVSSVMAIADSLKSKNMITSEIWGKIKAAEPQQQKMRVLLEALDSGGDSVKAEFFRLLKENEPHLVEELESGPSRLSPQ